MVRLEGGESGKAEKAEDSGVPDPQSKEGGRQAALTSPVGGRESKAVSSKASPSTMIQAMNAARVLLEKLEDGRMRQWMTLYYQMSVFFPFHCPLAVVKSLERLVSR